MSAQCRRLQSNPTKTTAKTDIVNYVLGLFTTAVLLVAWPRGVKGEKKKWSQVSAKNMADPAYLARLAQGNIGVILGPASGGIGSIDIDDDAENGSTHRLVRSLVDGLGDVLRSHSLFPCSAPVGTHQLIFTATRWSVSWGSN